MYQKILAPLDGSELSECSLQHVKTIATGCQVPEVVLLRVVEPIPAQDVAAYTEGGIDTAIILREARAGAQEYISKLADDLNKAGLTVRGVVAIGSPADEIMDYATENKVDLIIMSTHGRSGVTRWFMGSVADKVIRHSTVPVLVVSPAGCRTGK